MLARYQLPRGASMAWAFVARRALSPSTPRAQGAPLRASGVDRSARPSKWLSCQQCEEAPLGLPRTIFNRHPPEVSITEICYQFRVSHIGCSPPAGLGGRCRPCHPLHLAAPVCLRGRCRPCLHSHLSHPVYLAGPVCLRGRCRPCLPSHLSRPADLVVLAAPVGPGRLPRPECLVPPEVLLPL